MYLRRRGLQAMVLVVVLASVGGVAVGLRVSSAAGQVGATRVVLGAGGDGSLGAVDSGPPLITAESRREAASERPDRFSPTRRARRRFSVPVPEGAWLPLGPAPVVEKGSGTAYSGRVDGIVAIPSGAHAGRVVAATAGGGIWTSDDNGSHWVARTDEQPDLAVGSITVDPSNPEHLIAGTGEDNHSTDCFPGTGILVSSDGGTTWSLQNPGGVFSGLKVGQVAIDPSNTSHQFAATSGGLFVTTDGGTFWAKPSDSSYTALDGDITAVVIDPTTPTTVYIGGGPAGVGKSTDGGVHWATANTGITVAPPAPAEEPLPLTALAIAASSPSTLYASVGTQRVAVLYKSTNGGASWAQVSGAPDYGGGQGFYDNVLAVDPTNAEHLIAGGQQGPYELVETNNGGSSWTEPPPVHGDEHALWFRSDGKVWIGDDGGVFLYDPAKGTVQDANGNLNTIQFYAGFSVVDGKILAGSQDNGTSTTESSSLGPWTQVFHGDGGASAITPNEPSLEFFEFDNGLYWTKDAFATAAEPVSDASGTHLNSLAVVPDAESPSEPTVFAGGEGGLLRMESKGGFETVARSGPGSLSVPVSAIAVAPSDENDVAVGFTNGVVKLSTDGGSTFTTLSEQPFGEKYVTSLSFNPANPKELAASFSYLYVRYQPGFPHVATYSYATEPASGTWSTITGNLPSYAVSDVVYDKGALVAATDTGVYATGEAAGASTVWSRLGGAMPNVQVQSLDVAPSGLYAVTHGRGAWTLPCAALSVGTPALNRAVRGSSYADQLAACGGTPPYKWKKAGRLPKGLKLSNSGAITGTPSSKLAPGSYPVTVKVTDHTKHSATASFMLEIHVPQTVTVTFKPKDFFHHPEQSFQVPTGVHSLAVEAIGAPGGNAPSAGPGGRGAIVKGELPVNPHSQLYVEVGGSPENFPSVCTYGAPCAGGLIGGGSAGNGLTTEEDAGGGGGASDIQTTSINPEYERTFKLGGLDSRLLVAAGGGGGPASGFCVSGEGGNAESPGKSGKGVFTFGFCEFPGGEGTGGGAGMHSEGGSAGGPGGEAGSLGEGGSSTENGGGGGGGLYGGGAGGNDELHHHGGGGGGGGSNLVPPGGTAELAPPGAEPKVVISYSSTF